MASLSQTATQVKIPNQMKGPGKPWNKMEQVGVQLSPLQEYVIGRTEDAGDNQVP